MDLFSMLQLMVSGRALLSEAMAGLRSARLGSAADIGVGICH